MDKKQIIIAVVCVLVIAAAVVFIVKRPGASGPPAHVLQQTMTVKCLVLGSDDVVELTLKEWLGLPTDVATGYRKRGNQVLAPAGECPHCRQMIPGAPPAKQPVGPAPGGPQKQREYKCPKCGKNVLESPEEQ